jgi:hypothetical protein
VKLIALLSWYDEPTTWLAETVASIGKVCDHLIAVDGPYARFPGALAKPASGPEQVETILRVAAGAGIGCTIHAPRQPWWGGEVEKRDAMFRIGETFSTADDWYFVVDADEVISKAPSDLRQRLGASPCDAAELTLWERDTQSRLAELVDTSTDSRWPLRRLFRALPDLHIEQAHYVVTATHDGVKRVLCGNRDVHMVEPAEQVWDLMLEHRRGQRTIGRLRLKDQYGKTGLIHEKVEAFA